MMGCKTCGGTMVGDGYTTVRHCEFVDVFGSCYEPDAGPIYCKPEGPEITQGHRVWHSGPPPHVGWWQASKLRSPQMWRWWDGARWSPAVRADGCSEEAEFAAKNYAPSQRIEWNDYWPTNARVPRLAPEDFEIGARWVCVNPVWSWEFRGLEFAVTKVTDIALTLGSYRSVIVEKLEALPSEYHAPRRCVGPQTRWGFPKPSDCCSSPGQCRTYGTCVKGKINA